MNVFVTGGCGFIGSNFVLHLLESDPDCRIVNFDALTYAGNLDNLSSIREDERHRFVRGDITVREDIEAALVGRERASSPGCARSSALKAV